MEFILVFIVALVILCLCFIFGRSVEYFISSVFSKCDKRCNDWIGRRLWGRGGMADALDLKSNSKYGVWVRAPLSLPKWAETLKGIYAMIKDDYLVELQQVADSFSGGNPNTQEGAMTTQEAPQDRLSERL